MGRCRKKEKKIEPKIIVFKPFHEIVIEQRVRLWEK